MFPVLECIRANDDILQDTISKTKWGLVQQYSKLFLFPIFLSSLHSIILSYVRTTTYDHRVWKTGLPVRSAVLKPHAGELVVGWVTTSESSLLYVFVFFFVSFWTISWFVVWNKVRVTRVFLKAVVHIPTQCQPISNLGFAGISTCKALPGEASRPLWLSPGIAFVNTVVYVVEGCQWIASVEYWLGWRLRWWPNGN